MRKVGATSRLIASIGYEPGMLLVAFRKCGLHRYDGVQQAVGDLRHSLPLSTRFYVWYEACHVPLHDLPADLLEERVGDVDAG